MTEQESKKEFREHYYEERRERERRKAKKQKQTKPPKTSTSQTSLVKSELPKSTEDKAQVQGVSKKVEESIILPTINLEKLAISFKTAPLALDYPREKKERQLIVLKFKIISPAFEFLSSKLDTGFSTKKETRTLVVPKIKLLKPITEFSEGKLDIDYSVSKQKREVFVPKFVAQKFSMSFEMALLNTEILTPQSIQPAIRAQSESVAEANRELMELIQPQEETIQMSYAVEAQAGSGEEEVSGKELQDPLEFLFGKNISKMFGGDGRLAEPLVILFKDLPNDSYIQVFEEILLRLYREKIGGNPEFKKLTLREGWNKDEIQRWLDEGGIFFIELPMRQKSLKQEKYLSLDELEEAKKNQGNIDVKVDAKMLADRLWAIFSQHRGIVVFYTKDEEVFKEYAILLESINAMKLDSKARIVALEAIQLSKESKVKLMNLLYGFVPFELEVESSTISCVLNLAKNAYEDKINMIKNRYRVKLPVVKRSLGEESDIHLAGKSFIVHAIVKELQKNGLLPENLEKLSSYEIRQYIKTEEPMGEIIPDVVFQQIGESKEPYEFETLFKSEGKPGGFENIIEKLMTYEEKGINEVHIVVEPITVFVHSKEFNEILKKIRKKLEFRNLNIKFYTLDLKNEELMPLEDYLKELKRL